MYVPYVRFKLNQMLQTQDRLIHCDIQYHLQVTGVETLTFCT